MEAVGEIGAGWLVCACSRRSPLEEGISWQGPSNSRNACFRITYRLRPTWKWSNILIYAGGNVGVIFLSFFLFYVSTQLLKTPVPLVWLQNAFEFCNFYKCDDRTISLALIFMSCNTSSLCDWLIWSIILTEYISVVDAVSQFYGSQLTAKMKEVGLRRVQLPAGRICATATVDTGVKQ